jgi:membrane protein required for colicin V production
LGDKVTILDWIIIAIVGSFLVRGFFRGFLLELFDVFALLGGYLAARFIGPVLAKNVAAAMSIDRWVAGIILAIALFLITAVSIKLLARILKKAAKAAALGGVDRSIGGLFGLIKGLLLILIIFFILSITPASRSIADYAHKGTVSSWAWFSTKLVRGVTEIDPIAPTQVMAKWLEAAGLNDEAIHIIVDQPEIMMAILTQAKENDINIPFKEIMNGEPSVSLPDKFKISDEKQKDLIKLLEDNAEDAASLATKFWKTIKDNK